MRLIGEVHFGLHAKRIYNVVRQLHPAERSACPNQRRLFAGCANVKPGGLRKVFLRLSCHQPM